MDLHLKTRRNQRCCGAYVMRHSDKWRHHSSGSGAQQTAEDHPCCGSPLPCHTGLYLLVAACDKGVPVQQPASSATADPPVEQRHEQPKRQKLAQPAGGTLSAADDTELLPPSDVRQANLERWRLGQHAQLQGRATSAPLALHTRQPLLDQHLLVPDATS
jgi:hypothetical protein